MPKIKITRNTGPTDSGTGKKKSIQVTLANKKGGTTFTRSVSKDAGKKTTERSVVRNLRQGFSVKKTKEDGVKTKTYRAMVDRDGGKTYQGTDRKMFKAANKLNKVIEKRGRAADIIKKNQEQSLQRANDSFKSYKAPAAPAPLKQTKMGEVNLRGLDNIGSVPQYNPPKIKPMPPVTGYPETGTSRPTKSKNIAKKGVGSTNKAVGIKRP